MITSDEALARLLAGVEPLPPEIILLADAQGRVAAHPVAALLTHPPVAMSAMDGYAVTDTAGPWTVIGESAAGRAFPPIVGDGQTARIFTGAPMPAGARTVIIQEDVTRDGGTVRLNSGEHPRPGQHVRAAGYDFHAGDVLAHSGQPLTPARLGLLAAGGHGAVAVHRRPVIALLATGDELVAPGTLPGPSQIVSSNGPMLTAQFRAAGAIVRDHGVAPDDPARLHAMMADAALGADLLVTVGGASVGDHDLILPTLNALGATVDFWKIAIRPGKPMLAGQLGSVRVVGLPGNPVSAFTCALLFVLPLLRRLQGHADLTPERGHARLGAPMPANGQRRDHPRAWEANGVVTPLTPKDSGALMPLADANALIVREIGAKAAEMDEITPILRLDAALGVP